MEEDIAITFKMELYFLVEEGTTNKFFGKKAPFKICRWPLSLFRGEGGRHLLLLPPPRLVVLCDSLDLRIEC